MLESLLKWEFTNTEELQNSIKAYIINEGIKNQIDIISNKIFYINNDDYNELREYDIRCESGNYFINIICKNPLIKMIVIKKYFSLNIFIIPV